MWLSIYALVGIVWAILALTEEEKHYPDATWYHVIICGLANLIIWPVAIMIAASKSIHNKTENKQGDKI